MSTEDLDALAEMERADMGILELEERVEKLEKRNKTLRNLYNGQSTHVEELAKKLQAADAKVAALRAENRHLKWALTAIKIYTENITKGRLTGIEPKRLKGMTPRGAWGKGWYDAAKPIFKIARYGLDASKPKPSLMKAEIDAIDHRIAAQSEAPPKEPEDFGDICAKKGKHEEYLRADGSVFCRQCGVEIKAPEGEQLIITGDRDFDGRIQKRVNELTVCQASRGDGECHHALCPQARDGEPAATGRPCPLPHWMEGAA